MVEETFPTGWAFQKVVDVPLEVFLFLWIILSYLLFSYIIIKTVVNVSLLLFISFYYHLEIVDMSLKVKNSFHTLFIQTRDLSKVFTTRFSKLQRKIKLGVCKLLLNYISTQIVQESSFFSGKIYTMLKQAMPKYRDLPKSYNESVGSNEEETLVL